MPEYLAPGVYVEEIPAGVHAIAGVSTSRAAFLGATISGPIDAPALVHGFAEFQAQFGGLSAEMPLGYAVQHYFLNGGREALIARVVPHVAALTDADLSSPAQEQQRRGLWLLDHAGHFDILCIPPLTRTTDVGCATWDAAIAYATRRRAFVIVDPPAAWTSAQSVSEAAIAAVASRSPNAALYYPRLQAPDPLHGNQLASFAPCGAVAGIYARTDTARGVWKAPAGAEAAVLGVERLSVALSDAQLAALDVLGVNGLRALPGGSIAVWGARTLAGPDTAEEEWKYIQLRRYVVYLERSIDQGTTWTVFEPNDEPLWAEIRGRVGDFLHAQFKQGALQGSTPDKAFFVRCDASTTTQQDIDNGRLIVVVGVALVKPAEFVVIKIGIHAGGSSAGAVSPRPCTRVRRYALRVLWDGQAVAGVTRVRGLGQLTELVTVHEGGGPNSSHSIPGRTTFPPVTLERGIAKDDAFEQWADAMRASGPGSGAPPPRKDVRIELYDRARRLTVAWQLKSALPIKYQAPDLNAGDDVAIEELTLAHEGLDRVGET
jgi:phage tail-like protein